MGQKKCGAKLFFASCGNDDFRGFFVCVLLLLSIPNQLHINEQEEAKSAFELLANVTHTHTRVKLIKRLGTLHSCGFFSPSKML